MDTLGATLNTLLSPVILFFVLGFGAGLLRSNLTIPEALSKSLAIYLMLAIGFKGGVEMAHAGFDLSMLGTFGVALIAGFGLPVVAFGLLRVLTTLDRIDAASVAAHYGSISVVTFVAATDYVQSMGGEYAGYLVAVAAVMETPAIVAGLWLAKEGTGKLRGPVRPRWNPKLLRELLLNGSVVLLLGSLAIGAVTGEDGFNDVKPFIQTPFKGVLCIFLLDMGLGAASRLRGAPHFGGALFAFGVIMPLVGAAVGLLGSAIVGLSQGSGVLLATLCASASYIAVPAAMRVALPQANPAYSLTLSLGVTFPFNIIVGIALYDRAASLILS